MVTFETAVRLKEAGFPQPTLSAKQIWYESRNGQHRAFFLSEVMNGECLLTYLISGASTAVHSTSPFWAKQATYCPTVDDLFLAIDDLCGDKFSLSPVLLWGRTHQAFRATNATKYRVQGETSAEALANYWLELKLKGLKGITGKAEPDED